MAEDEGDKDALKSIFREFDKGESKCISRQKLEQVIKALDPSYTQTMLDALMNVVDKNNNGVIEYNEFVDFLFIVDQAPEGLKPSQPAAIREKVKMLRNDRWQAVVAGDGKWGYAADREASAIRMIVRTFGELDEHSPEGLTLAEEFVLAWQDNDNELTNYSFFGQDEPFHHAVFGACLLGLRARGMLDFKERDCRWTGKSYELVLSNGPPTDSEILKKVYEELARNDGLTLRDAFELKSGQWGQDNTTRDVLLALVHRGVLGTGQMGGVYDETKFELKDKEIEAKVVERLRKAVNGEAEMDNRSLALLALCWTADLYDPSPDNILMKNIFGKENAVTMGDKVEGFLVDVFPTFGGPGSEEVNRMVDALTPKMQVEVASEDVFRVYGAKFKYKLGGEKEGKIPPDRILECLEGILPEDIFQWESATAEGKQDVVLLFDQNQDGLIEEAEFMGFVMWCLAMKALKREEAGQ